MLPISTSSQAPADSAPTGIDPDLPADFRTILIVDDDTAMRGFAAMMLECRGFKTFVAGNGMEALQALQQHPEVNAVLLDILMPVMAGPEAFREIRKSWPTIRVILISGFDSEEVARLCGNPPPDGFVQKPFTLANLTGIVNGALN